MNTVPIDKTHSVCIYARERAELSGIEEVESFHEAEIILASTMGTISIEGMNLRIDSFSVESGKIIILGKITGFFYFEKASPAKNGLLSRRKK